MVTHHASQDSLQAVTADEPRISKNEALEQPTAEENEHSTINKGGAPVMRSKEDDLSIWQTVRRYKLVSIMAMAAAFSAALDGYRMALLLYPRFAEVQLIGHLHYARDQSQWWACLQYRIHPTDGQTRNNSHRRPVCLRLEWPSVFWSGGWPSCTYIYLLTHEKPANAPFPFSIKLLQYVTESYGRKLAFYIIWVIFVVVSRDSIFALLD